MNEYPSLRDSVPGFERSGGRRWIVLEEGDQMPRPDPEGYLTITARGLTPELLAWFDAHGPLRSA